ncbi:unnamed protein product, partial [Ectocarpus sp. 12 AP-2014]
FNLCHPPRWRRGPPLHRLEISQFLHQGVDVIERHHSQLLALKHRSGQNTVLIGHTLSDCQLNCVVLRRHNSQVPNIVHQPLQGSQVLAYGVPVGTANVCKSYTNFSGEDELTTLPKAEIKNVNACLPVDPSSIFFVVSAKTLSIFSRKVTVWAEDMERVMEVIRCLCTGFSHPGTHQPL